MRRTNLALVVIAATLALGADKCEISFPQPSPSPTVEPTPTPTPPPCDCRATLCPPGTHCEEGKCCVPDPTPTPTPEPTPTPAPTGCDVPLDGNPDMRAYLLYPHIVDSTPRVCNPDRCNLVGMQGRYCCPVTTEEHPQRYACEVKLMGGTKPNYTLEVHSGNLTWDYDDDWKAQIFGTGKGRIKSCYPNGKACSDWLELSQ